MPKSAKYLLIGSTEAYAGKSAIALGMANNLQAQGVSIVYGKPLGNSLSDDPKEVADADVGFISESLKLSSDRQLPSLLLLDENSLAKRLRGEDTKDYSHSLAQYLKIESGDLVLLEGPSSLDEGRLFDMSLPQMAEILDAVVLLVVRPYPNLFVDSLLSAKQRLGDRLLGVAINDTPFRELEQVSVTAKSFLEASGIPVFGILPSSALLGSVSVDELVKQLQAEIICRGDRLDLMVEELKIGAMNVSSAIKYFRQATNMAVVTGGDRTDIQLAALETSTHCLILTGQLPPDPLVITRAEDLEVPILSVASDTLTTVEVIDRTFGKVRLHEPIKVDCITQLMAEHFDFDRFVREIQLNN